MYILGCVNDDNGETGGVQNMTWVDVSVPSRQSQMHQITAEGLL